MYFVSSGGDFMYSTICKVGCEKLSGDLSDVFPQNNNDEQSGLISSFQHSCNRKKISISDFFYEGF